MTRKKKGAKRSGSYVAVTPHRRTAAQQSSKYVMIKQALENPKYTFRTIGGVAQEAKVSVEMVESAIVQHPNELVVLYRKGKNGEKLITTREHYKKKATVTEKIKGALLNRVY